VPRGLSFAETIARIRAQDGVVYVPHPFDRFHTTPARALLERHAGDIDVVETANGRLWLERDNRAAERFAREHGLRRGAGSDAHVPAGIGTAALRLAPFDDPASFLAAVEGAEIVRRARSMVRLQVEKRRRQRAR
jgi:predicted metal-dependent phosphoesterase TrpH